MSDEPKQAKATAKAAKAEAKALRPWYKKKRWWLVGVIVIGIAASAAGSGSSTDSTSSSSKASGSSQSSSDTISSGVGSKDATADVTGLSCGSPDALDFSYPSVTITNNSSKTSNYWITIVYESSDGSTKYGDSTIIVNDLASGQKMNEKGLPVSDVPSGAICKITEVQRTAS